MRKKLDSHSKDASALIHGKTLDLQEAERSVSDIKKLSHISDELSDEERARDDMLSRQLQEAIDIGLRHKDDTVELIEEKDSQISAIATDVTEQRYEAYLARAKLSATRTRMRRSETASLRKAEAHQTDFIHEADSILDMINNAQPNFDQMLSLAAPYYDLGERLSRSDSLAEHSGVASFTGHTVDHVKEVQGKLRAMLCSFIGSDSPVFLQDDVFDMNTLNAGVAFHDVGMRGNMTYNRLMMAGAFLPEYREVGIMDELERTREQHAIHSGVELLRHRESLSGLGVNVDQAAFLAALHSKSKKGFLHGAEINPDTEKQKVDLSEPLEVLEAAHLFKRECEDEGVDWDMTWLSEDERITDRAMIKIRNSASMLRMADACRDGTKLNAQTGASYRIVDADKSIGRPLPSKEEAHKEIANVKVYSGSDEITDERSRAVVFGERNISSMKLLNEHGRPLLDFHIGNPQAGVRCTANAVQERLDEARYSHWGQMPGVVRISSATGDVSDIIGCLDIPNGWEIG